MDEMLEYVSVDGIIQVSILYCHVDLKPMIVAGSCIDALHRPTLIIVDHDSTLSYASMFSIYFTPTAVRLSFKKL